MLRGRGWQTLFLLWCGLATLLLNGCATHPPVGTDAPADARLAPARLAVVDTARRMLGTPYRLGGQTPRGFDCSGLVSYSHALAGIDLPRTSAEQYARARPIEIGRLQPGDLVFFNINGRSVSHVGIYVGQGRFVHAPGAGKTVSVESLDNPYWRRRIMGAGHYFSASAD